MGSQTVGSVSDTVQAFRIDVSQLIRFFSVQSKVSSKGHSVQKSAPRLSRCALSWKIVRSSTMVLLCRIVYTKQTVELSIDLSTSSNLGVLQSPKSVLCRSDLSIGVCFTWHSRKTPNQGTRVVKKSSHSGNLVKFLSLGGDSSQNLVILVKLDPSG